MAMMDSSPYLPKNKITNYFSKLKTGVAYRVWKRKLGRYAGFHRESNFKILEVGCGPGYFLHSTEEWFHNANICGCDLDDSLVKFARDHTRGVTILLNDAHNLPFSDMCFDVVVSLQVIEHLKSPEGLLKEANRVLKRGGFLIITTPNPISIPAKMLRNKWPGYRHDHISLRTPHQWRKAFLSSGFQILEDGTTGFTGFKILQILPFALINWIPLALFGFFPWDKGASYMMIAVKKEG
jgi:SAM-dependent methyltransferase